MSRIFDVEPGDLARSYGSASVMLRHDLVGHPLLTIDAVADAAARMPEDLVEHNVGAVPAVLPDGTAPRLAESPGELARNIETNRYWMVLRWIHVLPEYAALRDELLREPRDADPRCERPVRGVPLPQRTGHDDTDPLRHGAERPVPGAGSEDVPPRAPPRRGDEAPSARDPQPSRRAQPPVPSGRPTSLRADAGRRAYVSPEAPHWVGNGPEVSISFSLVWHPRELIRARRVNHFNHALRARGRTPRPPGSSPLVDRMKSGLVWAHQLVRRIVGSVKPRRDA